MFSFKRRIDKLENDLKALKDIVDAREKKMACAEGRHGWVIAFEYEPNSLNFARDLDKPYLRCKYCYVRKTPIESEKT